MPMPPHFIAEANKRKKDPINEIAQGYDTMNGIRGGLHPGYGEDSTDDVGCEAGGLSAYCGGSSTTLLTPGTGCTSSTSLCTMYWVGDTGGSAGSTTRALGDVLPPTSAGLSKRSMVEGRIKGCG